MKKLRLQDAIGTILAHDITEICPQEFKGPAFREGHAVCAEDLCRPQKLGKNHHTARSARGPEPSTARKECIGDEAA